MLNVKKTLTKMLSGISGSNNCLRLGNVALCWGVVDLAGITANEFRTGSVTYPCVFATNPSTVMSLQDTSASPQLITWEVYSNSTTSFTWGMKSTFNGDYGTSHAYWIAIGLIGGGYSLKVFSIFSHLAERWWEYAERKEDSHEDNGERTPSANRFASRDAFGKYAIVCGRIYEHTERSNSQSGKFSKDAKSELGVQCNRFVRCGKSKGFVLQYGRGSGKWNIRRSGILHDIALISERGWCCA